MLPTGYRFSRMFYPINREQDSPASALIKLILDEDAQEPKWQTFSNSFAE